MDLIWTVVMMRYTLVSRQIAVVHHVLFPIKSSALSVRMFPEITFIGAIPRTFALKEQAL
jgi:hypothetical protein